MEKKPRNKIKRITFEIAPIYFLEPIKKKKKSRGER
jgi:hypothetical protein